MLGIIQIWAFSDSFFPLCHALMLHDYVMKRIAPLCVWRHLRMAWHLGVLLRCWKRRKLCENEENSMKTRKLLGFGDDKISIWKKPLFSREISRFLCLNIATWVKAYTSQNRYCFSNIFVVCFYESKVFFTLNITVK